MRSVAPPMLPLFRSDLQARLLTRLFLEPERSHSLAELASALGASAGSVHREVQRLERAGILASERRGRLRLVRPDAGSPYFAALGDLILRAFGPPAVLRAALAAVQGVDEAFLFGSWARRHLGEAGDVPADVDLLVIGEPSPPAVYAAVRIAEKELGRPVDVVILSPDEWRERRSVFLRTVAGGPMVPIAIEAS